MTVTSSHALLIQMSVFSSELTYQVLKIFFSPRKCSIEAPARCKTSVYVLIEICHQWAKRFITLFGKYQKNSWNWFLFFPNLFGVYTFMKICIFPNQNLYLEYRYAALNNIAIDLICRFLLGRPIPRAAFYICSMYKWLTS